MTSYHAPLAWLGSPSLASNVVFSVEYGCVTNVQAEADPTEVFGEMLRARITAVAAPGDFIECVPLLV